MGAWGARIYEDDVALDVRGVFLTYRDDGMSANGIEDDICAEYITGESRNDDVVWLALCCVELETGTLTKRAEKEALEVINSGRQYELWLSEAGSEDAGLRKRELGLIKKYINTYAGKPVKRKSWLEFQKADEDASISQQVQSGGSRRKRELIRQLPVQFWLWSGLTIAAFAVAAWCFIQVLTD